MFQDRDLRRGTFYSGKDIVVFLVKLLFRDGRGESQEANVLGDVLRA